MAQKVAIIGAGQSGLASIKCCLEEGLEPTCFEKTDGIGGLWRFQEIPEEGRPNLYKSVITNTSKEMTAFSDFPFSEGCPNYLRHPEFLEYLRMYAEHFRLLDYIHLKETIGERSGLGAPYAAVCILDPRGLMLSKHGGYGEKRLKMFLCKFDVTDFMVCRVQKHPDFATTGQWVVYTEKDGQQESTIFDAVMVCVGHYSDRHLPLDSFPGIKTFKGRYLHSGQYQDQTGFEGKRVLVLGSGNSGGDIAAEVSRTASKVFLSTKTGTWVVSRISASGWPFDMVWNNRFINFLHKLFSDRNLLRILAKFFNRWFNHENYGLITLESSWIPLIINEELPACILCGAVVVKPNVKEFTETSAIFDDGTTEKDIDVVIFATGYTTTFPFLEESLQSVCRSNMSLYKQIFPPHLEKHTLAIIGHIVVTGTILPATELQARWVARVFKGSSKLPPMSRQMSEVAKQEEDFSKKGIPMGKNKQIIFIDYMDDIATCLGVKPHVPLLFLTDPRLAWEVFFGPCSSYQFRLTGPGKWEKARNTILTQWDRALKPLKTRVIKAPPKSSSASCWVTGLGLLAFLGAVLLIFKYLPPSWLPRIK